MKKTFTLVLGIALLLCLSVQLHGQTKKVLFLGNSYTYYNGGLELAFKSVANSMGDEVEVTSYSPGGYTLEGHSTNSTSLTHIASQEWDYVVLQEQSQKPSFSPSQVEAETYPYAKVLCDSIANNSSCTTPIFFMTWGRENGDASNCASYPPICTYLGMSWRLRQSYVEMAEDNDAWVSPVGMVWKAVRESNPEIDLYQSDESHPSNNGTYLAACTFYSTIFHKSPVGASYPADITPQNAEVIQNAVWSVFTDSLDTWLVDTTTLRVDFEPLLLTKSVEWHFQNFSENSDSSLWLWGDGEMDYQYPTGENYDQMIHNFPTEGDYNICLKAWKGCTAKQICKDYHVTIMSGVESNEFSEISLFPNPSRTGYLNITGNKNEIFKILSIDGKQITSGELSGNTVDISMLSSGIYFLKIDGETFKFKVIRE